MKIRASACFIIHDKKILLYLRDDIPTIPNPNTWATFGGIVEEGETHWEGLLRELQEEINVVPEKITYIGELKIKHAKPFNYDTTSKIYISFITEEEVTKIKLGDEGQYLQWFTFDELDNLKFTAQTQELYDTYKPIFKKVVEEQYVPQAVEIGLK